MNSQLASNYGTDVGDWAGLADSALKSANDGKIGLAFILEALFVGGIEIYSRYNEKQLLESLSETDFYLDRVIYRLEELALAYEAN